MCGINGITAPHATDRVVLMNKATERRGPEGSHVWSDDKITLGHNLLATMGVVENSKQPMHYEDSAIVFNGAIFNWKQLDEWDSGVDTQVLLKGLHHYGLNFLDKCEGMWAFAWYKNNKLILCRDRFGVKPLLYKQTKEGLIFSSSPHALENTNNKLDLFAFSMFRSFGYVPGYLTLIEGVHKCVPGEVITYDFETKKIEKSSIWKKPFTKSTFDKEEFLRKLQIAVNYSGVSSRQRGLFLSGGLDSSSIMHFINEKNTFTTRYDPPKGMVNDDSDKARKLAEDYDLNHTEVLIAFENFKNTIKDSVRAIELPTYNKNNPSYYIINKFMREQGTIVTYSGDGGDEMYTGYNNHNKYENHSNPFLSHWKAIAWKSPARVQMKKTKMPNGRAKEYCEYMRSWFPTQIFGDDYLNNCLAVEMLTRVSDEYLARNDRFGAYFGMEGRFPLLNHDFYYYIMGIPSKLKMHIPEGKKFRPGEYKYLARHSLEGVLPAYITNKQKTGWANPPWINASSQCFHDPADQSIEALVKFNSSMGKMQHGMGFFKEWTRIYNVTA